MDDFETGDALAVAGDRVALEYGWWADEWIIREAKESKADPASRAAFSYALTVLEQRHGRYLSRAQITDRVRIGRAFPRAEYKDLAEELHYDFTFSQLRAAYIRDDPDGTTALLLWAAETDAEPAAINARKVGGEVETEEARTWRNLCQWAEKYLFRGNDEPRREICREILKIEKESHEQGK